jgi:cell division protein ZapB
MGNELLDKLEERVSTILETLRILQEENQRLNAENTRLLQERVGIKARIDAVLSKLEGI